jgi:hypothetical protein
MTENNLINQLREYDNVKSLRNQLGFIRVLFGFSLKQNRLIT